MKAIVVSDQLGVELEIEISSATDESIVGILTKPQSTNRLLALLRKMKEAADEQLLVEVDRIDQEIGLFKLRIRIKGSGERAVKRMFLGDNDMLTIS